MWGKKNKADNNKKNKSNSRKYKQFVKVTIIYQLNRAKVCSPKGCILPRASKSQGF